MLPSVVFIKPPSYSVKEWSWYLAAGEDYLLTLESDLSMLFKDCLRAYHRLGTLLGDGDQS